MTSLREIFKLGDHIMIFELTKLFEAISQITTVSTLKQIYIKFYSNINTNKINSVHTIKIIICVYSIRLS